MGLIGRLSSPMSTDEGGDGRISFWQQIENRPDDCASPRELDSLLFPLVLSKRDGAVEETRFYRPVSSPTTSEPMLLPSLLVGGLVGSVATCRVPEEGIEILAEWMPLKTTNGENVYSLAVPNSEQKGFAEAIRAIESKFGLVGKKAATTAPQTVGERCRNRDGNLYFYWTSIDESRERGGYRPDARRSDGQKNILHFPSFQPVLRSNTNRHGHRDSPESNSESHSRSFSPSRPSRREELSSREREGLNPYSSAASVTCAHMLQRNWLKSLELLPSRESSRANVHAKEGKTPSHADIVQNTILVEDGETGTENGATVTVSGTGSGSKCPENRFAQPPLKKPRHHAEGAAASTLTASLDARVRSLAQFSVSLELESESADRQQSALQNVQQARTVLATLFRSETEQRLVAAGNLYAKTVGDGGQSKYYMYLVPQMEELFFSNPKVSDDWDHFRMRFPGLGHIVFARFPGANVRLFKAYKIFSKANTNSLWVPCVAENGDSPNRRVYILPQNLPEKKHKTIAQFIRQQLVHQLSEVDWEKPDKSPVSETGSGSSDCSG